MRCFNDHKYSLNVVKNMFAAFIIFTSFFLLLEILFCLYHFVTELVHNCSMYNNVLSVAEVTVHFNRTIFIIMIIYFICFLILFFYDRNIIAHTFSSSSLELFSALAFTYIFLRSIDIAGSILNKTQILQSMKGLDYGSSMAYSYFYGYLNIIIPSNGADNEGIRKKIEKYEDIEGVNIPVKKLFILIPASAYIPPNFEDISDKWMETTKNLEHVVLDRAGIKERKYQNTVYKIFPNGTNEGHRPVYILVEGATPMLTFYEVLKHNNKNSKIYQEYRPVIVKSFLNRLQELLDNNPDCTNYCELVYYQDMDENGRYVYVNPAKILLDRIRKNVIMKS